MHASAPSLLRAKNPRNYSVVLSLTTRWNYECACVSMKTGGVELWEGGREQRMEEDGAREISKRLFSFHSSVRN